MILDPHQPPVVPYCGNCDQPVEQLRFDTKASQWRLGMHFLCCGRSGSVYLTQEEVLRATQTQGEKYYVLHGKHSAAQFKARKRG